MPFLDLEPAPLTALVDTPANVSVTPGQADVDHGSDAPEPFLKRAAAELRLTSNLVAPFYNVNEMDPRVVAQEPEDGFNSHDKLFKDDANADLRPFYKDRFAHVRNQKAFDVVSQNVRERLADRKLAEGLPWYASLPLDLAIGVADPFNLLPAGYILKAERGAWALAKAGEAVSIPKTAGTFATGALGSVALSEAAQHTVDPTRTKLDTAVALGGSVIVGGLLGAVAGRLSNGEWLRSVADADRIANGHPDLDAKVAPVYDDLFSQAVKAGSPAEEARRFAEVFSRVVGVRHERMQSDLPIFDYYKQEGRNLQILGADGNIADGASAIKRVLAGEGDTLDQGARYPLAPRGEWYGNANYEQAGGRMTVMTPDEFLARARPLQIDEVSRENIDILKQHIVDGKTLDPLAFDAVGKEDGRHRAVAAKELGIARIPVLDFAPPARTLDQSAAAKVKAGPEAPGVGVAAKNTHGFVPDLRVIAPKAGKLPDKPIFTQTTTNGNAAAMLGRLDEVLSKFPNATDSAAAWSQMMAHALGSNDVPIPPYGLIRDLNGNGAAEKVSSLTPGQIKDADHGFAQARKYRAAYEAGQLKVADTGRLFLWSFLSRGVSPYTQESLFIDAFKGINPWIEKAAAGKMTEADLPAYYAWASTAAPKGSGQPGAGASHNLNGFGRDFLLKMGQRDENGVSSLQRVHDMLSDPKMTGQQIRREFMKFGEGVGIDNKVVSFTLLITGHNDVMVLDRVQISQLWNEGRFADRNLYDGTRHPAGHELAGKVVTGSPLANLTYGARGLLIYEAIERGLQKHIKEIYTAAGRPGDASIGRYHWESWVAHSQQEASHGTIGAILAEAKGHNAAIATVTAKQGEYGSYEYGARYGHDENGTPFFSYATPMGGEYNFSVPAFRSFLEEIKKPGTGVVPTKFKVTEAGNAPWTQSEKVDWSKLEERAQHYADRGSSPGTAGRERDGPLGGQVANGTGRGTGAAERDVKGLTLNQGDTAPRGNITLGDDQVIIRLLNAPDASTLFHEGIHWWFDWLQRDALKAGAPTQVKADYQAVLDWFGVKDASQITREHLEMVPAAFERYIATGKAPIPKLQGVFDQIKEWLVAIYKGMTGLDHPVPDDIRQVFDRMLATDAELKIANTPMGDKMAYHVSPQDIGAAAMEPTPIDGNTIAGKMAGTLAAATARLNPLLYMMHSPSPAVRHFATQLVENAVYLKKHFEGAADAPSVETLMKQYNAALGKTIEGMQDIFADYSKVGGKLSWKEFKEEIGRAMRVEDQHADPHITKAAQQWRREVFDPLKEQAIQVGLLPADVQVTTAPSYFSRMWNRNKLIANEGDFLNLVSDFYNQTMMREYDSSFRNLNGRMAKLDQEIADLQLSPDARAAELTKADSALQALDRVNPDLVDKADRLTELTTIKREATKAGDRPAWETAKAEENQIRKDGGQPLADYLDQRSTLRAHRKHVDLGSAGLQERADRVLTQLADLEEANHRAMQRLVKKGQKLERDLDRLDADALEARVTDLADTYAGLARKAEAAVERARKAIENIKAAADRSTTKDATIAARATTEAAVGAPEEAAAKKAIASEAAARNAERRAAADQKIQARLEKEAADQAARAQRMEEVGTRLRTAVDLDHDGLMAEIKSAIDKATRETSAQSLARGERAARLGERIASLDPQRVADRIKVIETMKADAERAFYDRWEIRNLGSGVNMQTPKGAEFKEQANAIARQVFDTLTGKNADGGPRPEFMTIGIRGPMKDRTFNIPDRYTMAGVGSIEDFLEHDVEQVGRRYIRTMSADVEMVRKFGTVDMADQIAKIHEDYARLRSEATTEKERLDLGKREDGDLERLTGVRDRLRGTRNEGAWERKAHTIVRAFNHINYIRSMGEVVVASLTDVVRPAMVHGLLPYMGALAQLGGNLKGFKLAVKDVQLSGNAWERVLGGRFATLTDIMDPYASRGPIEALLERMTDIGSKWNGIRLWTDMMKEFAGVMTQQRILENAANFTKLNESERAYMALLHIDEAMAERIAEKFKTHGAMSGSLRIGNTDQWVRANSTDAEKAIDEVTKRTFYAASNKDLDSIIIQAGVADTPLFGSTPVGKAVLQFKTFALASHQRLLMRGLQESQVRLLGGIIAMTTIGMFMTWMKSQLGNRYDKMPSMIDNPGWWVSEGLDRSGAISVPMELSNIMEKAIGVNPIKSPIRAGDVGNMLSQKNQNRNDLGSLLGPSAGAIGDMMSVAKMPQNLIQGKDVTQGEKNAIERLVPFNSYLGARQIIRYGLNPQPFN